MESASTNQVAYRKTIRELSDRLVEVQRPIRILDAIKWDSTVQSAFFATGGSEQPLVDRAYYESRPLGFDPALKRAELHELEREVSRRLGSFNPVGGILRRMCREYAQVVHMLEARGTAEFGSLSQELYGSASDAFHAGEPSLADLGVMMSEALSNIDRSSLAKPEEKNISGDSAVSWLAERIARHFPAPDQPVHVKLSDGIIADAAAGADYIKIRKEARFSEADLRLLEIHEGWVHLGTTLNGKLQPYCTFLSKGPPSSTITQEGLAILMEVIGFASSPWRLRRLTNRIRAVEMAENGASFVEVYRFFLDQRFSEAESFTNAARVFRGSTPDGPPFTKDLTYSKGFVLVYNFVQLAVRRGLLERIPMLFCGKSTLEDLRTLAQLVDEGLVVPPRYLPPQFADLNALAAWMCYSNFLNIIDLERIEADYSNIL
ncbi:MAG: flavohemoglobin expression-modulating QEGLA motif protein [Phycisphaerales bacterium]